MNLFILSEDIEECVTYYVDAHQKIILEAAQMLCTSYGFQGIDAPYRATHINHPVNKWVRESNENFDWTIRLAYALNSEYIYRGRNSHKSIEVIKWCDENRDKLKFKTKELTMFVQAMPDKYKDICPIRGYRKYYKYGKINLHKWTGRPKPFFIN